MGNAKALVNRGASSITGQNPLAITVPGIQAIRSNAGQVPAFYNRNVVLQGARLAVTEAPLGSDFEVEVALDLSPETLLFTMTIPAGETSVLLTAEDLAAAGSGWTNGYSYRREIMIDHTKLSANVADFPVLVLGTYTYLKTTANGGKVENANGYDIIFTSDAAGENLLDWEVESYNAATGAVRYWVKLPSVSSSVDATFYLFYGKASVSSAQSTASDAWSSDYRMVLHLGDGSTLSLTDSTVNANSLSNANTTAAAGQIGGSASFNGTNSKLTTTLDVGNGGPYCTVEMWANFTFANDSKTAIDGNGGFSGNGGVCIIPNATNNSGTFMLGLQDGAGASRTENYSRPSAGWHHYMAIFDLTGGNAAGAFRLYIDGAEVTAVGNPNSGSVTGNFSSRTFIIGGRTASLFIDGEMDEIRVSSAIKSAGWALAAYNNQSSPATFYAIGAEENLELAPVTIPAFTNVLLDVIEVGSSFPGRDLTLNLF